MKKNKQFDFNKYIPNTGRKYLDGVYFKDGFKIITDARFLICCEWNYPVELEGVFITKDFAIPGESFPPYEKIIPNFVHYNCYGRIPTIGYGTKNTCFQINKDDICLGFVAGYILNIAVEFQEFYHAELWLPDKDKTECRSWVLKSPGRSIMVISPMRETETACILDLNGKLTLLEDK